MNQLDPDESLTPDDWVEINKWRREHVATTKELWKQVRYQAHKRLIAPIPYWRMVFWIAVLVVLCIVCELMERWR